MTSQWLPVWDAVTAGLGWMAGFSVGDLGHAEVGVAAGTALAIVAILSSLGGLAAHGMYRSWAHIGGPETLTRTLHSVAVAVVAVLLTAQLLDTGVTPSRVVTGGIWMLGALLVGRWVVTIWEQRGRRVGRYTLGMLLVGANDNAFELWRHIATRPDSGRSIVGYVGDRCQGARYPWPIAWLGDVEAVTEVAQARHLDGLVIAHGALSAEQLNLVIRRAHGCGLDVELSGGITHLHHRRLVTTELAHEPVLFVEPPHEGRIQNVAKRLFDLLVGGLLLVAVSPLFIAVALLVAVMDGRPIFYRQLRVGKDRQPFRLWKFRTMERDADRCERGLGRDNERRSGPLFKLASDPRTTRFGRLLRATSIDELPQLLNVLAGSMSLVGPRPALPAEVADFDVELQTRSRVRPGMTGLWQIEARDNPEFYAYRQLDLFYAENWSLALDVAILLYTVPCLIRHACFERRQRSRPHEHLPVTGPNDDHLANIEFP